MIMPTDGNRPEDEMAQATLDELNRRLAETVRMHNAAPDPEMGGLSPKQVASLLYSQWDHAGAPIRLNGGIPLEALEGSAFFRQARTFLCAVRDSDGVKTTTSGNLNRRFVAQMMDAMLSEEQRVEIRRFNKAVNEEDVGPLHIARVVAKLAGLVRLSKGSFIVPKAKLTLLASERAGELFREMFLAFFRKFNLAYLARYGAEAGSIQSCAGYTFYRLGIVARDWHATANLPEEILLPAVRREVEAEIDGHAYWNTGHLLSSRIVSPLIEWGLLDGRYEHKESKHFKSLVSIRTTPLYPEFFRFHVE